jgi:hypothetical protein
MMAPELPDEVVPVLNTSAPLAPDTPAFALRTLTIPELVAVPSPVPALMVPPVFTVLRLALTSTNPPDPLVPLPTVMSTAPLRPLVDAPLPRTKAPEFPELVVPVLNTSIPLTPDAPVFAVRMLTTPDDVAVPSPEPKLTEPPV